MKLIIGLGNPAPQYRATRHNAGFCALDALGADSWRRQKKFSAECAAVSLGGEDVLLIKPQLFMNRSGEVVKKVADYYGIDHHDMLVIYDDIDLLVGELRLRTGGSSGGHNGMASIIAHMGTQDVARLKLGIAEKQTGKQRIPSEHYVLKPFSKKGEALFKKALEHVPHFVAEWVQGTHAPTTVHAS